MQSSWPSPVSPELCLSQHPSHPAPRPRGPQCPPGLKTTPFAFTKSILRVTERRLHPGRAGSIMRGPHLHGPCRHEGEEDEATGPRATHLSPYTPCLSSGPGCQGLQAPAPGRVLPWPRYREPQASSRAPAAAGVCAWKGRRWEPPCSEAHPPSSQSQVCSPREENRLQNCGNQPPPA